MKKIELLAPAGDRESLIAAIQNGADAIYLGGSFFNARAYAKNFDYDDLKWAVSYAHVRNVKVYVTVNTLYKDSEFVELMKYIDFLYDIQVDALIIQDLGLFHLVKKRYNDFEIHMSTQASVMNKYSADYFKNQGASRVVLARENTIDEIREIAEYTDIELEVFVHGALCMGYSGQCLMSSMIGKRSGNRGQCAQPCRLEYRLKRDDNILENENCFLLSPKDLMTIDHIGELIDVGVTSFKIEGRMKKPEYVAAVVKAYRKAIDNYLDKRFSDLSINKQEMRLMFNRDYTSGYLFNDRNISDGHYSGNRGIVIGNVISYNKKKKRVLMKLSDSLKQGDSILFESIDKGRPVNKMFKNNKLVNIGNIGEIIEVEFDYFVNRGNVRKIIDNDLLKRLQATYNKEFKKNNVDFHFVGRINEYACLTLKYQDIEVFSYSDVLCQLADKVPLEPSRIQIQLSKLGDTPFQMNSCVIDIDDDIILPIKSINDLRRDCIKKIIEILEQRKIHNKEKKDIILNEIDFKQKKKDIDLLVSNLEQLKICLKYPFRTIYYPYSNDALEAVNLCKEQSKDIALFIPRIIKSNELIDIMNSKVYNSVDKVVVNDYGSLSMMKDKEIILGTGINVFNSYSAQFNDKETVLSLEMDIKQINDLKFNHKIIQIYGKTENMISEFCPISQFYYNKQMKKCNKCKNHQFSLIDRKNIEFDIMMDEKCRMHLLNNNALYYDNLNKLKTNHYLIHFTNENDRMVKEVLEDYFHNIINGLKSKYKNVYKTTNGYLH